MKVGWEAKSLGEVCTIKPPKAEARAKLADGDEVVLRTPQDILDEIAAPDAESAEVLATIRGLVA